MTTKELYEKYKDIFILAIETAGEETGNSVYRNVSEIINSEDTRLGVEELISYGCRLDLIIVKLVCDIVLAIHGIEKLNNEDLMDYANPIFELYLKKPTRAFCQQNGIPVIKSLEWKAILKKIQ